MSSTQNRYGVYGRSRLPREKRSIPVSGDLEDDGRYFKCWNCGFVCDSQRDITGDGSGVTTTTYVDTDGVIKYMPDVVSGCPFCGTQQYQG